MGDYSYKCVMWVNESSSWSEQYCYPFSKYLTYVECICSRLGEVAVQILYLSNIKNNSNQNTSNNLSKTNYNNTTTSANTYNHINLNLSN